MTFISGVDFNTKYVSTWYDTLGINLALRYSGREEYPRNQLAAILRSNSPIRIGIVNNLNDIPFSQGGTPAITFIENLRAIKNMGTKVAKVCVPHSATIRVVDEKQYIWTSSELIITEIMEIYNPGPFSYLDRFGMLRMGANQTFESCKDIIRTHPLGILHIRNQLSPDGRALCCEAIKYDPTVFKYIIDPTIDMMREMVTRNYRAIKYIDEPPAEIQVLAVRHSADAINSISTLCDEAFSALISAHPDHVIKMKKPGTPLPDKWIPIITRLNKEPPSEIEMIEMEAIAKTPMTICYIANPTPEMWIAACKKYIALIHNLNQNDINLTEAEKEKVYVMLYEHDPNILRFIPPVIRDILRKKKLIPDV